jgi:nucleotide-binding universal stress UspA family protein
VILPLGPPGTGEERVRGAGLVLRQKDGRTIIDLIQFGSAAERAGLDFDFEITSVLTSNDRPPAELVWIPATERRTCPMYRNILLPVDLSDKHSWRKALPTALALSTTFQAGLHVMTVLPAVGSPMVDQLLPPDYKTKLHEHAAAQLEDFIAEQVPEDVTVKRIVAVGSVYREILSVAKEIGADLIVMGSHRPELADYLLGANAAKVVRHANCSVMVVRA